MFNCSNMHLYIYRRSYMDVSELEFCQSVEENLKECDGYIEAVIEACIRHNIDIRAGAKLISQPIIEKIQSEGENTNLLPKFSKLPV